MTTLDTQIAVVTKRLDTAKADVKRLKRTLRNLKKSAADLAALDGDSPAVAPGGTGKPESAGIPTSPSSVRTDAAKR